MVQSSMTEKKRVYSAYRRAEQHMVMALKARKGEIKVRHSGTVIKALILLLYFEHLDIIAIIHTTY